jgi:hypothetical protein
MRADEWEEQAQRFAADWGVAQEWALRWKRACKRYRELVDGYENVTALNRETMRLQAERHRAENKAILDQWNRDLTLLRRQINTNNKLRMHINEYAPGTLPKELR